MKLLALSLLVAGAAATNEFYYMMDLPDAAHPKGCAIKQKQHSSKPKSALEATDEPKVTETVSSLISFVDAQPAEMLVFVDKTCAEVKTAKICQPNSAKIKCANIQSLWTAAHTDDCATKTCTWTGNDDEVTLKSTTRNLEDWLTAFDVRKKLRAAYDAASLEESAKLQRCNDKFDTCTEAKKKLEANWTPTSFFGTAVGAALVGLVLGVVIGFFVFKKKDESNEVEDEDSEDKE